MKKREREKDFRVKIISAVLLVLIILVFLIGFNWNKISGRAIGVSSEDEEAIAGGVIQSAVKPVDGIKLSVATLKDEYKVKEKILLTDPPDEIGILGNVVEDSLESLVNTRITDNVNSVKITRVIDREGDIGFEDEGKVKSKGYIIEFKDKPLVLKEKELAPAGVAGISTSARAGLKTDVSNYKKQIRAKRENIKNNVKTKLRKKNIKFITGNAVVDSEDLNIFGEYENVFNGIALDITAKEAEEIKTIPGVKSVSLNLEVKTMLRDSVPLIGADKVWELDKYGDNCAQSGGECLTGRGVKIAIIDTGIDYTHADLGCKNDKRCENAIWYTKPPNAYSPKVYNNKIIWTDNRNGRYEIYMYDLLKNREFQITTEEDDMGCNLEGLSPDIYEDKIVYGDCGQNLYLYDIPTETRTLISHKVWFPGIFTKPKIYKNIIVWKGLNPSNQTTITDILMYDISTGQETILTDINYQTDPDVYENKIVWVDHRNTPEDPYFYNRSSIYLYDITTKMKTKITDFIPEFGFRNVKIYQNKIIWKEGRKKFLYMYDMSTKQTTIISDIDLDGYSYFYEIYADKIVWTGLTKVLANFPNYEIYMYDISTGQTKQITSSKREYANIYPSIQNNSIVWAGRKGKAGSRSFDIYMYDISTGQTKQITFLPQPPPRTNLRGLFPNSKIIGGYDFVSNDKDPIDDHGHGTHVAGIAAGSGAGGLKGVAPESKLYAYKVLDSRGSGSFSNVISAIERAVDPNQDGDFSDHLDIISMSLGGNCKNYTKDCGPDDPVSKAIDNVVSAGVIAVIASGNSGPEGGTITSPGTARKAITIGATDKQDKIASFSSGGPVKWTDSQGNEQFLIKPDLVAPGVNICSAQWDSAWNDKKCLDNEHVAISGTSMATPMVAGAVALLKQKHPDWSWSSDDLEKLLTNISINLGYSKNVQGYGRINLTAAILLELRPQSKLTNVNSKPVTGTLRMYLQKKDKKEKWVNVKKAIDRKITIPGKGLVKLDNGKDSNGKQRFKGWNNLNVFAKAKGDYRVYTVLVVGNKKTTGSWEFEVA